MKLTLRVQKHETYQLWLSSIKKNYPPLILRYRKINRIISVMLVV